MKNLLFSKNHIWIKKTSSNTSILGVSDYAQEQLGTIVFVNLPCVGDRILENTCFGDMESIKTVSDLISPINGTVLQINEMVLDNPDLINSNPYDTWLLELSTEDMTHDLMNKTTYLDYLEQL